MFIYIGCGVRKVIDFFYPPFERYVSLQFFRYAVCGVSNLLFDWILYYFIFNFVLRQQMLSLGFVTLSSHIATFVLKFPITLLSGFLLQKYVTFSTSGIRGRIQLFRYLLVVTANILLNYAGLKLLVNQLGVFPSIANASISVFTAALSYVLQKSFTFKQIQH